MREDQCDVVVVAIGGIERVDVLQSTGADMDKGGVACDGELRTSLDSVFACGDIAAAALEGDSNLRPSRARHIREGKRGTPHTTPCGRAGISRMMSMRPSEADELRAILLCDCSG